MGLAHDIIHFDGIVHYKPYPQLWKPPHDTRFAPPRLDLQQEIAPQVWECLGRSLVVLKSGDFMVRWWGVNGDLMGFNQSTWHDRWVWKWWNMKPWSPLTLWAMFHRENEDEPEGFIGGETLAVSWNPARCFVRFPRVYFRPVCSPPKKIRQSPIRW